MSEAACQAMIGVLVGIAFAISGWLGITVALGAHPFWALQVVWVGVAASFAGCVLLWRICHRDALLAAALSVGLVVAVALTIWGKNRFVTSYAEDFIGGRLWYFGWMASVGFAHALIWQIAARYFCRPTA